MKINFHSIARNARKMRVVRLHGIPPPLKAEERRVCGLGGLMV